MFFNLFEHVRTLSIKIFHDLVLFIVIPISKVKDLRDRWNSFDFAIFVLILTHEGRQVGK